MNSIHDFSNRTCHFALGMPVVSVARDYEVLGQALAAAGEKTRAIAALEQALALNPHDQRQHGPFEALCELYQDGGIPPDAYYEMLARELPNHRSDAKVRMEVARWHEQQGDFEAALDMYRSAAGIRPGWISVHRRMAPLARHLGQIKLALASYKLLLRDRPNNARLKDALMALAAAMDTEEEVAEFLAGLAEATDAR